MAALKVIAWASFALAALFAIMAAATEAPMLLGLAVSLVISGTLFLAVSKVIDLLTDIRDALVATPALDLVGAAGHTGPVRSIEEIDADLKRLSAGKN